MSIHNEASFQKAYRNRAAAAWSRHRWGYLTRMSKRELSELVCHLAALATESYDETIQSDDLLIARIDDEIDALRTGGLI